MTVSQTISEIEPISQSAFEEAKKRWDSLAKPLGGLGQLETMLCQVAAIQYNSDIDISKRALVVFCADNGVVCEGISQSESEVTTIVAQNLCAGVTSSCRMAAAASCEVIPVDVGILEDPAEHERLHTYKVASGTRNIAEGPAMSRDQLEQALETGIEMARMLHGQGYNLLAAGEMGIGNTTTSSAVASVLFGKDPEEMTGRGAGLSSEGLKRKVSTIERAIAVNNPDPQDPLDVLQKVGGFDIAAMCGFYLGAAQKRSAVILDGFISGIAAVCAAKLCPDTKGYMLASHRSSEPAAQLTLETLGLEAPISAGMHLGEGTGAMTLIPLLDMAVAVYSQCTTFEDSALDPYEELQ